MFVLIIVALYINHISACTLNYYGLLSISALAQLNQLPLTERQGLSFINRGASAAF